MANLADLDLGDPETELPSAIGPFEIVGRLGRGGMGVVLDARAPDGAPVALKLIRPQHDEERQRTLDARLLREARILQQIRHRGIVSLVEAGTIDGVTYVAMERIEGVTLHAIRKRSPLDRDAVISLAIRLSDALAHLHDAGVIHRDVKPGNVLVQADGRVVLADFGIARQEEATGITKAGEVVGSAGFLAPECFHGKLPNERSDQYSLGVLLFEMAAQRRRSKVPKSAPLLERFVKLRELDWARFPEDPGFDPLRRLLERVLATRPEDRFPSMRACQRAFEELEDQLSAALARAKLGVAGAPSARESPDGTKLSRLVEGLPASAGAPWMPEIVDDLQDEGEEDVARALFGRVSATAARSTEITAVTAAAVDARTVLGKPRRALLDRAPSGSAPTVFEPDRDAPAELFGDDATQLEAEPSSSLRPEPTEPEVEAYDPLEATELEGSNAFGSNDTSIEETDAGGDAPRVHPRAPSNDPSSLRTEMEGGIEKSVVEKVSLALDRTDERTAREISHRPRASLVSGRVVREAFAATAPKIADPALSPGSTSLPTRPPPPSPRALRSSFVVGLGFGLLVAFGSLGRTHEPPFGLAMPFSRSGPLIVEDPTAPDVRAASARLDSARAALVERDLVTARKELVACVKLGGVPACHELLGTLLSLGGEPGAASHLARARR
ncbi:MAG: serine/threonine protein kinase [Deltaproteobacteria bacterium]|nr:serine/threonine protein kinase [Deltaproteobacteria bacterium]